MTLQWSCPVSSVGDLKLICDHLMLLDAGRTVPSADPDEVFATHRRLTAVRRGVTDLQRDHTVLRSESTTRQVSVWIQRKGPLHDPGWRAEELGLEDIMLAHLGHGHGRRRAEPSLDGVAAGTAVGQ